MSIRYQIQLNSSIHQYNVKLHFIAKQNNQELKLATWIPGSYMIREFSKNIVDIQINNSASQIIQVNKNTWYVDNLTIGDVIEVEYNVYALDFGIRTAYLDNERAYFNATSLCVYLPDCINEPHVLEFLNLPPKYNIATGLLRQSNNAYVADNYQHLIDCPFEIGDLTVLNFTVNNTPHRIVLSGNIISTFDKNQLIADVTKICSTQIDMFGGTAPFTEYTFLLYLGGEIFTGLEHCNSTALMAPYYSLPSLAVTLPSADYIKLLGLISHEYFHLWNVKRIKPVAFSPYDMENENYTKLLWWFEGITSYYDDLVMYRAGVIDQTKYLQLIVDNINNVYKFDGVNRQSLNNSSLTSWVKYYRQDENSPNAIVSYYVKGALVGMCLDLLIRKRSNGIKSLDDVLRGFYNKWQNDGLGLAEDDIPKYILHFTGVDLSNEIDRMTNSCEDLALNYIFADYGLQLHKVNGVNFSSAGKVINNIDELPSSKLLDLSWKLNKELLGYKIINIYNGGVAANAGFATGDLLIAIDGIKITDIDKQINLYNSGDIVTFVLLRHEKLLSIQACLNLSVCNVQYLQVVDANKLKYWL